MTYLERYYLLCLIIAVGTYVFLVLKGLMAPKSSQLGSYLPNNGPAWKAPFTFFAVFFLACPFLNLLTLIFLITPGSLKNRVIQRLKQS